MARPLQIGVTGGIGAGKSMVCQIFQALGAPVYAADERAKWLTNHDPVLRASVTDLLGEQAYIRSSGPEPGVYNRAWVATQVFTNPALLAQLNAIIHPRVLADTVAWVERHADQPYVIKEAALMRSARDPDNPLDSVIVVTAPTALRIRRIRQRDPHRSETEILNIIDRQISDAERLQLADYVLPNDESQLLLPQVVRLHEAFTQAILAN